MKATLNTPLVADKQINKLIWVAFLTQVAATFVMLGHFIYKPSIYLGLVLLPVIYFSLETFKVLRLNHVKLAARLKTIEHYHALGGFDKEGSDSDLDKADSNKGGFAMKAECCMCRMPAYVYKDEIWGAATREICDPGAKLRGLRAI